MGRLYHNLYFVGMILKLKIERWNLLILLKYFCSIQGLIIRVNFLTYWLLKSLILTKYSWVGQCFKERRSAFDAWSENSDDHSKQSQSQLKYSLIS